MNTTSIWYKSICESRRDGAYVRAERRSVVDVPEEVPLSNGTTLPSARRETYWGDQSFNPTCGRVCTT
jgi:hypothetical protein